MTKPYPKRKIQPKLYAEKYRLERVAASEISEEVAKYITVAHKKIKKAIELLEKEENEKA